MELYPHLPLPVARKVASEIAGLLPNTAEANSELSHVDMEFSPIGGGRVDKVKLESIRSGVLGIAKVYGYPKLDVKGPQRLKFDAECTKFVYENIKISPVEAADDGLWSFLSCVLMPNIAIWRFRENDATNIERLLGGRRNIFQRLWRRADILRIPTSTEAPYAIIDALMEDECVQIQERPTTAGMRALARAAAAAVLSDGSGRDVHGRKLMRDVQKRLMRLSPMVSFEVMSDTELRVAAEQCTAQANAALKSASKTQG